MNHLTRNIDFIPAEVIREGAGVIVHRTIGASTLRNFDPFLLLDHLNSDRPDDYVAGFPSHPHRGFVTFTYLLDGQVAHKDSMGNTGIIDPGSAQWMKAASGIIHSEMPQQQNGLLRGFQLWINLPAAHKMDHPEYREYTAYAFPIVKTPDYTLKVLIGSFAGQDAPIKDESTDVSFFDVLISPGSQFQFNVPAAYSSFLYVFEGNGQLNDSNANPRTLAVPGAGDNPMEFVAGEQGARLLAVCGKPIKEPIVRHGPFVMNTREEIDQAMQDYQSNQFVRERAWIQQDK